MLWWFSALSAFVATQASADAGLPDLVVDQAALRSSISAEKRLIEADSCAAIENCVTGLGLRRLLLFDAVIANVGQGALELGAPFNNPYFEYSACHEHYHFSEVMTYQLLSPGGEIILEGRKQGFCFRDDGPFGSDSMSASGYNCDFQGLSPGWSDVYDKTLDCQWLDISSIPAGHYLLRLTVNPESILIESDFGNNVAEVAIHLTGEPV